LLGFPGAFRLNATMPYWVMAGAFLIALTQADDPGGSQLTSRSAELLTSTRHQLRNQASPR
jgi:hypothetical protein